MKFGLLKLLGTAALLLFVFALPLHADTSYAFSSTLVGVSNTTVSGTFSYNLATNTISGGTLSFSGNSIFAGLTVNIPTQVGGQGQFLFSFTTSILNPNTGNMDQVTFGILLDPSKGTILLVAGKVYDPSTGTWGVFAADRFQQVPESGNSLSYLIPSLMVMFGSVLLVGKRRRLART